MARQHGGVALTNSDFDHQSSQVFHRPDPNGLRVRALAEAGAKGHVLTPKEVQEICEALRSQKPKFRNNFHGGGVGA